MTSNLRRLAIICSIQAGFLSFPAAGRRAYFGVPGSYGAHGDHATTLLLAFMKHSRHTFNTLCARPPSVAAGSNFLRLLGTRRFFCNENPTTWNP
jgi:hypothetical protein